VLVDRRDEGEEGGVLVSATGRSLPRISPQYPARRDEKRRVQAVLGDDGVGVGQRGPTEGTVSPQPRREGLRVHTPS